jgi:hypothetical protein
MPKRKDTLSPVLRLGSRIRGTLAMTSGGSRCGHRRNATWEVTMTKELRSRFSYANVVSTLALFLVVAGGVALGRTQTQQGGATLQHQLKVVKGLVKEVEAGQQSSSQQAQSKLDDVHNAVIDAHVQLGSQLDTTLQRLDTALDRLRSLCFGESTLNLNHELHDDRTNNIGGPLFAHPIFSACRASYSP